MSRQTDIQKLITIYSRRLQKLREQEALYGLNTAPEIQLEIETIEDKLERLQTTLENCDSTETEGAGGGVVPAINIADELAQLENTNQPQTVKVNISDVNSSSIKLGNIVTGNVEGDVVAGNKKS